MFIPQTVTPIWSRGCYGNRAAWFFVFFFKIYKWRRGEQRQEWGRRDRNQGESKFKVNRAINDRGLLFWKSNYLGLAAHPDRFEEVQVGQEVALCLV